MNARMSATATDSIVSRNQLAHDERLALSVTGSVLVANGDLGGVGGCLASVFFFDMANAFGDFFAAGVRNSAAGLSGLTEAGYGGELTGRVLIVDAWQAANIAESTPPRNLNAVVQAATAAT